MKQKRKRKKRKKGSTTYYSDELIEGGGGWGEKGGFGGVGLGWWGGYYGLWYGWADIQPVVVLCVWGVFCVEPQAIVVVCWGNHKVLWLWAWRGRKVGGRYVFQRNSKYFGHGLVNHRTGLVLGGLWGAAFCADVGSVASAVLAGGMAASSHGHFARIW